MRVGACLSAAATAAALVFVAAAAAAQPAGGGPGRHRNGACISPAFIDGISAPNDHTAYLSVGPNDMYRLETMGPCINLDWPMTPKRLINKNGPGGDICAADDMVLIVGRDERCYVSAMHKMTPAEIQGWRRQGRHPSSGKTGP